MGAAGNGPWDLYDELIEGVPADVRVADYALGLNWSYVQAESGCGIAYTARGGAKRTEVADWRGRPLRDMAALAKSWCFEEATLGIAALNAWYGREENLRAMGAVIEGDGASADEAAVAGEAADALAVAAASVRGPGHIPCGCNLGGFELMRPQLEAFAAEQGRLPRVVVVGHFPHMEELAAYTDLTVLERNVRDALDTPDPACEYVLPTCDFSFITGVTLINKTAPRLLELAVGRPLTMVGPTVVASPALQRRGAMLLAGRYAVDPDRVRFACTTGFPFGSALKNYAIAQA